MSKHRQQKPSDFHPVIPNIIDETMRADDPDVKRVKRHTEQQRLKKEVESAKQEAMGENAKQHADPKKQQKREVQNSVGRSIIIGILIVVITVLVILLIYQVYKMLTTDEDPLEEPPKNSQFMQTYAAQSNDTSNSYAEKQQPNNTKKQPPDNTEKCIPDHVRNMDNNALSQFIKKSKPASNNTNSSREIAQKNMIDDTTEDPVKIAEEHRVSNIIDNAMQKDDNSSYVADSDIPSREDEAAELRQAMLHDKQSRDELFTVAEEDIPDMPELDDFSLVDEDTDSVKSESGGCQFILTKGKNKGHPCGRSRSTEDRCFRHEGKH